MADPLDQYAVMGDPIAHSKSPLIHRLFGEQTGIALQYRAIQVPPGSFARAVSGFRDAGGRGLNITLPYKREAHDLAVALTPRASLAGAANTLWFDERDRPIADNTDGAGLVRDLQENNGVAIRDRRVLLLGAGGAARSCLPALLDCQPASITIANRNHMRAQSLQSRFSNLGPIQACALNKLGPEPFDIVINATSASLRGNLPPLKDGIVSDGSACYDMMYAPEPTIFMRWGREHGAATVCDGLGMLVEQAAESFWRWHGVRPRTMPVLAHMRPTAQG